eukprot:scaffold32710_cov112-Isochrysis_galbana.AAC.2
MPNGAEKHGRSCHAHSRRPAPSGQVQPIELAPVRGPSCLGGRSRRNASAASALLGGRPCQRGQSSASRRSNSATVTRLLAMLTRISASRAVETFWRVLASGVVPAGMENRDTSRLSVLAESRNGSTAWIATRQVSIEVRSAVVDAALWSSNDATRKTKRSGSSACSSHNALTKLDVLLRTKPSSTRSSAYGTLIRCLSKRVKSCHAACAAAPPGTSRSAESWSNASGSTTARASASASQLIPQEAQEVHQAGRTERRVRLAHRMQRSVEGALAHHLPILVAVASPQLVNHSPEHPLLGPPLLLGRLTVQDSAEEAHRRIHRGETLAPVQHTVQPVFRAHLAPRLVGPLPADRREGFSQGHGLYTLQLGHPGCGRGLPHLGRAQPEVA